MSTEERKVQFGFVAKNETKPGLDAIKSDVREMAAAEDPYIRDFLGGS